MITLSNTTASGNSGNLGGGIAAAQGSLALINSTVSGTLASRGGGIDATFGSFSLIDILYRVIRRAYVAADYIFVTATSVFAIARCQVIQQPVVAEFRCSISLLMSGSPTTFYRAI